MVRSLITNDRLLRPEARRAMRMVLGLIIAFIVISAATVVATHALPNTPDLMTPAARTRSIILLVAGAILLVIALLMDRGSRKACLYVRIEAIALLVSVVVLVAIPGVLPPWMNIEQIVCGALLLGITIIVSSHPLRAVFRRPVSAERMSSRTNRPHDDATPIRRVNNMNRSAVRTACTFSALCVLIATLFTVRLLMGIATTSGRDRVFIVVALCATVAVGLLLLAAAVTLWLQAAAGQHLMIVGASMTLATTVSYSVYNYFHGPRAYGGGDLFTAIVQVLLGVTFALGALLSAASVHRTARVMEA